MAEKTQLSDLKAKAREHVIQLVRDIDWASRKVWVAKLFLYAETVGFGSTVGSDEEVRDRVAAAITRLPDMLEPIL